MLAEQTWNSPPEQLASLSGAGPPCLPITVREAETEHLGRKETASRQPVLPRLCLKMELIPIRKAW